MKALCYFTVLVAFGAVAVTGSSYQIEKMELASADAERNWLALAAPDVPVPAGASDDLVARADHGDFVADSRGLLVPLDGRSRHEAQTARRVSTAQHDISDTTNISSRDLRGMKVASAE